MKSREWRRQRRCIGKRRYQSLVQAQRYIDAFHALGKAEGLDAYACSFCGYFHIGHPRKRSPRAAITVGTR